MVVGKDAQGIVLPPNPGCTWKVYSSSSTHNVRDAYSDPDFDASVDISTGYKTQSMLGAPIRNVSGETIGVLLALNKHNSSFSSKDEAIIMHLASQAGIAIQNSLVYQQAANNELKSRALLQFVRQISKDTPGQSLAVELVAKAKDLLGADSCNIFMIDSSRELLMPIASDSSHDFRLPLNTGILGLAANSAKVVNIHSRDARFSREFDELFGYTTETLLVVPIKAEERAVGLIQVTNKHSDAMFGDLSVYSMFDDDDVELLTTLSEILAKKLGKLISSLSAGIEGSDLHAVKFSGGFGKTRSKSRELPEGAIKETDEEEESKN